MFRLFICPLGFDPKGYGWKRGHMKWCCKTSHSNYFSLVTFPSQHYSLSLSLSSSSLVPSGQRFLLCKQLFLIGMADWSVMALHKRFFMWSGDRVTGCGIFGGSALLSRIHCPPDLPMTECVMCCAVCCAFGIRYDGLITLYSMIHVYLFILYLQFMQYAK